MSAAARPEGDFGPSIDYDQGGLVYGRLFMQNLLIVAGPIAAAAVGIATHSAGLEPAAATTAGLASVCALWWMTEAVPIPATSLLPIALLPALGILTADDVGRAYGHPVILLLLGGFILSTALEKSGVHRRLAIGMVRLCAEGPRSLWEGPAAGASSDVTGRRLVIGFMLASALVSMWVSNAATTLMLLPLANAALEGTARGGTRSDRLRNALLLGIAYAASIGGVATPIGTPPNLLCLSEYRRATGVEISFLDWLFWGGPATAAMLPCAALWLTRGLGAPAALDLPESGPWRPAERRTLAVFAVTALLWVTRTEPLGGWTGLVGLPGCDDACVALLAVVLLFLIPSGEAATTPGAPAPRLLDWESAARIPWGMLLLFSGGMVLAQGFTASGLSAALGGALQGLAATPPAVLVGTTCLCVTFLTELTSNTATTAMLMPVLAATADATGLDPRLLMFPAAVTASFAFMLPVGTVPNAIVYGAGVSTRAMAREGLVMNFIGVAVVTALALLLLE